MNILLFFFVSIIFIQLAFGGVSQFRQQIVSMSLVQWHKYLHLFAISKKGFQYFREGVLFGIDNLISDFCRHLRYIKINITLLLLLLALQDLILQIFVAPILIVRKLWEYLQHLFLDFLVNWIRTNMIIPHLFNAISHCL